MSAAFWEVSATEPSRPGHRFRLTQSEQQAQLLVKQGVVVTQVVPEQTERVGQRTAAEHVQPDLVSERDLFQQFRDPLSRTHPFTDCGVGERVRADLHLAPPVPVSSAGS